MPTAESDRECSDCTPCDRARGFYEATICTLNADRACEQCSAGEYLPIVGGCTACSECSLGSEYEAKACSGVSDAVCKQQRSECDCTTHFESVPPGPFNDRVCTPLTTCVRAGQHQVREPTCTSNRVCSNTTTCIPGQYELKRPTLTSNRQCVECDGETEYQNEANQPSCKPMAKCTPDVEYEIPGNKSANRVCLPLSLCGPKQYEAAAATAYTDRQCEQCRPKCKQVGIEFEASPCAGAAGTTDRICTKVTVCNLYSYQTAAATQSSDRVCSPHTKCARGEYPESLGSQWSDVECRPYTKCKAGSFELLPPTATSDRECRGCNYGVDFSTDDNAEECTTCAPKTKQCGPGQLLSTCTEVHDRECEDCPTGTFLLPEQSECKQWALPCDIGQWESLEPTAVYDRACSECSPGMFRTDMMAASGGCAMHTVCTPPNVEIKGKGGSAIEDRECTVGMTEPPATTTVPATELVATTTTAQVLGNGTDDGSSNKSVASTDITAGASFTDDYLFMILIVLAGMMLLLAVFALLRKTKEAAPRIVFDRATHSVALVASPGCRMYYTLDGSEPKAKGSFTAAKTHENDPHAVVPLPGYNGSASIMVQAIAVGNKTKKSEVVTFVVPAATPVLPIIIWTEAAKPEKKKKVEAPKKKEPQPDEDKDGTKKKKKKKAKKKTTTTRDGDGDGDADGKKATTKGGKGKKKKKKTKTVGFKRMGSVKAATTHAGVHSPTQAGGWVGGGDVTYVGPSSHMAQELFQESADGNADFAAAAAHAVGADLDHNNDDEAVLGTLTIGVPKPNMPGTPPPVRIYYTTDGSDPVVPGNTLPAGAPFPAGKLPPPVAPTQYYDPLGPPPIVSHRVAETATGFEIRAVALMAGFEPSPVATLTVAQLPAPVIKCCKPAPLKASKKGAPPPPPPPAATYATSAKQNTNSFDVILDIKGLKHNGKVVKLFYSIGEHSNPLPGSSTSIKYDRKAKPRLTKRQMHQTIKAVAILEGSARSKVAVATLTPPEAERPTIRCEYGYLSIEASEPDSLIYYTLDGSEPVLPSFWAIDPSKPQPPTMLYKGGTHSQTHLDHEPSHVHENLSKGPGTLTPLTVPRGMPVTIKAVARNPMSSSSNTATLFVMEPNKHDLDPPYIVPHRSLAGVELYLEPGDNNPKRVEIYYTIDGTSPYSDAALIYDNDNPHFFRPAPTKMKYTVKAVTACDNAEPSPTSQTIVNVDATPKFGQPMIESVVTATGVEVYIKAASTDTPSPPPIQIEVEVDDDSSSGAGGAGGDIYGASPAVAGNSVEDDEDEDEDEDDEDEDEDEDDDADAVSVDSAIEDDSEVDVDADEPEEVLERMRKKEQKQDKKNKKQQKKSGKRVSFAGPIGKKTVTRVVDAERPDGRHLYYCIGANTTPLPGGNGSIEWNGEPIQFHRSGKAQHICIKAIAFGHLDLMQPSVPAVTTISVPANSPPAPPTIVLGGELEGGMMEVTMSASSDDVSIYYILGEASSADLLPENGQSKLYNPDNLPTIAAQTPDQTTDRVLRAVAIAPNAPPSATAELRLPAKPQSPTPKAPTIRATELEGQGFDVAIYHAEVDVMDEDIRLFYTIGAGTDPIPGKPGTYEFDGATGSSGVFVESEDLDEGFVLVVRAVASRRVGGEGAGGRWESSFVTSISEVGIPPEPVFEPFLKPTISVVKTERGLEIKLDPRDPPSADGTGNVSEVVLKYNVSSELVPDVDEKMPFIPYPLSARPLLRVESGAMEAVIKAVALEKGNHKRPRSRAAELRYPVEQTAAPTITIGPSVVFDADTDAYWILLTLEHPLPDDEVSLVYTVDGSVPVVSSRKSARRTTTAVYSRAAGASKVYVQLEARFNKDLTIKAAAETRSKWCAPSQTASTSARQAVKPVVSARVKIETIPLPAPGDPLPFELTAEENGVKDQLQALFVPASDGGNEKERAANVAKGLAATMPRLEMMSTFDRNSLTDIVKSAGTFQWLPQTADGKLLVLAALFDRMRDDSRGLISFREFLAVCLHKRTTPDIVADVTLYMSSLTDGSNVYYTSDGSAPSTLGSSVGLGKSSVVIAQPLSKGDLVVKTIAVAPQSIPSDVTITTVVVGHVPTPKVRVHADANHTCLVTMEPGKEQHHVWSTVSDVPNTVYYTLDGTEPTLASNIFSFGASRPVELKIAQPGEAAVVLRARAIMPNGVPSECVGMRIDMAAFGYQTLTRNTGSFRLNRKLRNSGMDFDLVGNDPLNPNPNPSPNQVNLIAIAKKGKLPGTAAEVETLFHRTLFAGINKSYSDDHAALIDKAELEAAWNKELAGSGNGTTREIIAAQIVRSGAEWDILAQVDANNNGNFEVGEFWEYANVRNRKAGEVVVDAHPSHITVNEFLAACGLHTGRKMRESATFIQTEADATRNSITEEPIVDGETPL